MNLVKSALLACLLFMPMVVQADGETCTFEELVSEQSGSISVFSDSKHQHTFRYDDERGKVFIKSATSASECELDASIVNSVYLSSNNKIAFLRLVGGPSESLMRVDLANCLPVGEMLNIGYENSIGPEEIVVMPQCECTDITEELCYCQPAKVFDYDSDCKLKENAKKSAALTKKTVKVGFTGEAQVRKPYQEDASLIEK